MEEAESLEASPLLQPGAIVGERWQLVEKLGSGGFGSVWRATHVTLAHAVAVKFLQAGEVTANARARFEREARIAARLGEASRHITRVIDYGVFRESMPYLCMELLHGETLSQCLRREKRLSLRETARMILQLGRALQVAHTAGVIHRDLKPSNVFLSRTDVEGEVLVKLLDFGIAKSTAEQDGDETTRKGTLIGTPAYMSPEQILCKKLDARADLWGVAACVYRMVCGRSPFGQGSVAELGLRILATDPVPPSTLVPELPPDFDKWMEKALAKSAEERFQSARDLADALAVVAAIDGHDAPDGVQTPVPERLADSDASPDANSLVESVEQRTHRARPSHPPPAPARPRALMAMGALLVGVGIVGAIVAVGRMRAASAEPPRTVVVGPPRESSAHSVIAPTPSAAPSPIAIASAPSAPPPPVAPLPLVTAVPKPTPSAASGAPKTKPSAGADAVTNIANEAKQLWGKKDEL